MPACQVTALAEVADAPKGSVRRLSALTCQTLRDRTDCSPPGSSVRGILQARILERVAMPSSRGSAQPRVELASLPSPALAGRLFPISATRGNGRSQSGSRVAPDSLLEGPRVDPCHRQDAEDAAAPANALARPGPSALERLPAPGSAQGASGTPRNPGAGGDAREWERAPWAETGPPSRLPARRVQQGGLELRGL